MSKKQPKHQVQKKETEIVDQQKDPMLRALQKKVRNINKKLNQIAQLSTRKDLKPEQEQKISKKEQIQQEREKYTQMIQVYKQIAVQNQKIIRKTQLAQLQDLASVIAAKEYGVNLGPLNQNIDNLVKVLTNPTSADLSLRQRIDEISSALTNAASNNKLKKNLKEYVDANQDLQKIKPPTASSRPQPLSSQSQKQRQTQLKELQKQQQLQAQQTQPNHVNVPVVHNEPKVTAPQVVLQAEPQVASLQAKPVSADITVAQTNEQKNNVEGQKVQESVAASETVKQGEKGTQGQNDENKQRKNNRSYQGNNRGGRGGYNNKYGDNQKPYKKTFKPKYEGDQPARDNKNEKNARRSSSSSLQSSGSEPKARQFKREQVRQLIEDGFIVVGKPKVKGRDQKEYHNHQHGNKSHHHNSKKNY